MWVLFYPKFRDLKDVLRIQSKFYHIVGKNGKTANLKTGFSRKQSTPNFPKNEQFLPPWYAYVRVFASANSLEIITSFEMSFKRLSWGLFTLQDLPNFCFFKKKTILDFSMIVLFSQTFIESPCENYSNTEFFLVCIFLCLDWTRRPNQSEYKKIRTRKIFVFGHFSRSVLFSC